MNKQGDLRKFFGGSVSNDPRQGRCSTINTDAGSTKKKRKKKNFSNSGWLNVLGFNINNFIATTVVGLLVFRLGPPDYNQVSPMDSILAKSGKPLVM